MLIPQFASPLTSALQTAHHSTTMFAPTVQLFSVACLIAVALTPSDAACATAPYGKCGSNASGLSCCPDNFYCQPWDAGFFQCMPQPAQCKQQLANVDLYGNDIRTVYGLQPSACCTECANTPGCVAYTFVNSNPGQPACYLKKAIGEKRTSVGAVSGIVNGGTPVTPPPTTAAPTTTQPTVTTAAPTTTKPAPVTTAPPTTTKPAPGCATPAYGGCGNSSGSSCCPSGFFCQPWNPTYYQCIATPAQCSKQLTDTDFYGNDIATVYVSLPSLCCDECKKNPKCKAYTYINNNPGKPVCYLKSAAGAPTRLVGAVAGQIN